MLPGVAPTGRHVEVALVVVVEFVGGRISGERIYWDQAGVEAPARSWSPRVSRRTR